MDHATLKDKTIEQQQRRQAEFDVSRFGDEIGVDGMKLVLVDDFKEAFSEEGLALRYTPLLKQYDYIVGDLSAGQLRLRGFYHEEREVPADQKINTLADYLYETVNFGAPYFILQNETVAFRPRVAKDYLAYWEEEQEKKRKEREAEKKKHKKSSRSNKRSGSNRNNRPIGKRRGEEVSKDKQESPKKHKKTTNRRHRFTTHNKDEEAKKNNNQTPKSKAAAEGKGDGEAKPKRRRRRRNNRKPKDGAENQGSKQNQGQVPKKKQGGQSTVNQGGQRKPAKQNGQAKPQGNGQNKTQNSGQNKQSPAKKKRPFTIQERK